MKFNWAHFNSDESGAITVDWVVLTAAIVGLGLLVLVPIAFSANSASNVVGQTIGAKGLGF